MDSKAEYDDSIDRQFPTRMENKPYTTTGRLSTHDFNFGIPTNQGAQEHVKEYHGHTSWRSKILKFLHQHWVQQTLMLLLLLDVVILFIELFLFATYPPCQIIERDCISCCEDPYQSNATIETDAQHRFMVDGTDDDHHSDGLCEAGLEPSYDDASCDPHKWHKVHTAETVLFSMTMLILGTFVIELHAEMIAFGPCIFFRQIFYLVDYFIVMTSISLELLFKLASEDALQSLVGLIVFSRIWRFVRIGHGIVEVTSEATHQQYEELLEYTEAIETIMRQTDLPLPPGSQKVHRIKGHDGSIKSTDGDEHEA